MADMFGLIQSLLTIGLPIGAFWLARRRSGHTRLQLIGAAALGGGVAGALTAAFAAAGGTSLSVALPFAFFGLGTGLGVGLLGVAALALGRWLGRQP